MLAKTTKVIWHDAGRTEQLGVLWGGLLRKNAYVLFPSAGCALISSTPKWSCFWQVLQRWREEHVGFFPGVSGSSSESAAVLMSALRQVRGQQP